MNAGGELLHERAHDGLERIGHCLLVDLGVFPLVVLLYVLVVKVDGFGEVL